MQSLINLLDKNLKYINNEIKKDTITIEVESNRESFKCPNCNVTSNKVHSRYERSFQDLPILGKKVVIVLSNRKFLCKNSECNKTTFAETFDFISSKSKKTKRLEEEIIKLSVNTSSIAASKYLCENTVNIGKSTICTLLKKRGTYYK